MDLFEYQGKQFFSEYGMPISPGQIAFTVEEAVSATAAAGLVKAVKPGLGHDLKSFSPIPHHFEWIPGVVAVGSGSK